MLTVEFRTFILSYYSLYLVLSLLQVHKTGIVYHLTLVPFHCLCVSFVADLRLNYFAELIDRNISCAFVTVLLLEVCAIIKCSYTYIHTYIQEGSVGTRHPL